MLAPLRNQRFFSGGELNLPVGTEMARVNGQEFRGQPTSRRDLSLELERPALQPLPPSRYEFTEIKNATANIGYGQHRLSRRVRPLLATDVDVRHREVRRSNHLESRHGLSASVASVFSGRQADARNRVGDPVPVQQALEPSVGAYDRDVVAVGGDRQPRLTLGRAP